jgi:hypothetical protein
MTFKKCEAGERNMCACFIDKLCARERDGSRVFTSEELAQQEQQCPRCMQPIKRDGTCSQCERR